MKIEIRQTKSPNIIQITTVDERWYDIKDKKEFYSSSSWITDYWPKGIAFYKWLAGKGWDEAEFLKKEAGDKGNKIHHAIEQLVLGNEIKIGDSFPDSEGNYSEVTVEEWDAVMSFIDWWNDSKPKLIACEQVVANHEEKYAGTIDLILEIDGEVWIVDLKTSQNIWMNHRLQVSSYKHAYDGNAKIGILQIGYKHNKRGWKFTEIEDQYDLFLTAKRIWYEENKNKQPKQKDYPITLKLEVSHGLGESLNKSN